MSEPLDPQDSLLTHSMYPDMDDVELLASFLNGQLDPERSAAVRKRLEEDAAFRQFAGPMLMIWSIPKHLERRPRPEGELEREWEKLTTRVGITLPLRPEEHSRGAGAGAGAVAGAAPPAPPSAPRKRVRWGRWIALAVFGFLAYNVGAYTLKASANAARYIPENDEIAYTRVPNDTGWIALNDGITVRLEPGASLRTAHRLRDGKRVVKLTGTARFRIAPRDTARPPVRSDVLIVEALVGSVGAFESEFTVAARPDTTLVTVHHAGPRTARERDYWPVQVVLSEPARGQHHFLLEGEGARITAGHDIQIIR